MGSSLGSGIFVNDQMVNKKINRLPRKPRVRGEWRTVVAVHSSFPIEYGLRSGRVPWKRCQSRPKLTARLKAQSSLPSRSLSTSTRSE